MHTNGNAPQVLKKTSVSKFRGPPEWREVRRRVLYKICKKCTSRARAPRGCDARVPLIDIKSDSTDIHACTNIPVLLLNLVPQPVIARWIGGLHEGFSFHLNVESVHTRLLKL